jgi:hypothetical protein
MEIKIITPYPSGYREIKNGLLPKLNVHLQVNQKGEKEMRRIPILLSMVLVLAFALASCADADEGTQVPGVTDGFDLTTMPPTGEPGGFPGITEPAITATEPVEPPTGKQPNR